MNNYDRINSLYDDDKKKENISRNLEENKLDFFIKANEVIFNGYSSDEYFKFVYKEKYSELIECHKYYGYRDIEVPNSILYEYNMIIKMLTCIGISITTQKMIADVCNAGTDKIKIATLLSKYDAKYLGTLETSLLKRLLVRDNFVCVQNFRRLFEADNLDFFKMANTIASNGYTLERFDKIIMCKSFIHITNGKIAKSVCQSYKKYMEIIEFAGIPFKEEVASNGYKEKILLRGSSTNNILKV